MTAPPRRHLTRRQRAAIFDDADGICHICGEKIDPLKEPWQADHVIARALTGSDDPGEFRPAHLRCHGIKTKTDVAIIAKAERIRARERGIGKTGGFRGWRKFDGTPVWKER